MFDAQDGAGKTDGYVAGHSLVVFLLSFRCFLCLFYIYGLQAFGYQIPASLVKRLHS